MDEYTERRIKESANVKDVISDFIQLKRAGTEWTCKCPFHNDRHAGNFKVNTKKNMWYCFVCDEGGDAVTFLMKYKGCSYMEAMAWLAQKYGISIDDAAPAADLRPTLPPQVKPKPVLAPLEFPLWMPKGYMSRNTSDTLCAWLRGLPWSDAQRERVEKVLRAYMVGQSKDGYTMFWQIDEGGHVRTAKMMRYRPDGHRDKALNTTWYHARMNRRMVPDGCGGTTCYYNDERQERIHTLFGMHLLTACPKATVCIVESEKTALIATIAYGGMRSYLWMATGGESSLNAERLAPIISRGHAIMLYPDVDAIDKWRRRKADIMEETGYKNIGMADKFILANWDADADGPKADLADIIVRLLGSNTKQEAEPRSGRTQHVSMVLAQMIADNPVLQQLMDTFNLEEHGTEE